MNVVSFSLYGDKPIYCRGAIENAKLMPVVFPDWRMRVYHNSTVPGEILQSLRSLDVDLIDMNEDQQFVNSIWRFAPASEPEVERFISRDCDSRLFERDAVAVQEWIESGKDFHIIRDHPKGHFWQMNAGMWGCKGGCVPDILGMVDRYYLSAQNARFVDQLFLKDKIYSIATKSLMLHDEYFDYEGIGVAIGRPREADAYAFIGEQFEYNGQQLKSNRTIFHENQDR